MAERLGHDRPPPSGILRRHGPLPDTPPDGQRPPSPATAQHSQQTPPPSTRHVNMGDTSGSVVGDGHNRPELQNSTTPARPLPGILLVRTTRTPPGKRSRTGGGMEDTRSTAARSLLLLASATPTRRATGHHNSPTSHPGRNTKQNGRRHGHPTTTCRRDKTLRRQQPLD